MAGVNKVILVGNLGRDPEIRSTPTGASVANFSIATSESWVDKQNQKQEKTEWHRIVVWGKLADLCGQFLTKGRKVYVEGRLQTREWTDKEGRKAYTTEVVANQIVFLGGDRGAGGGRRGEPEGGDDYGGPPGGGRDNGFDGGYGYGGAPSGGGSYGGGTKGRSSRPGDDGGMSGGPSDGDIPF